MTLRLIPANLRLRLIFKAKKHPAKLLDAFLVIDADLFAVFKVEVNWIVVNDDFFY